MKCKNCKYFEAMDAEFGHCDNPKLHYAFDDSIEEDDELIYEDNEQNAAFLYVGRNFGCIHYQEN